MRRVGLSIAFALIAALMLAGQASAVDLASLLGAVQEQDNFRMIHVGDLAAMIADHDRKVWIYDANRPSLRASAGIVPGAHLLGSYDHYDLGELPPDKNAKLVFYCANTH